MCISCANAAANGHSEILPIEQSPVQTLTVGILGPRMAALLVALFIIVVAWGWFLVPKKSGSQRPSALNFRDRLSSAIPQRTKVRRTPDSGVAQASFSQEGAPRVVPVRSGGEHRSMATRRRQVRRALVVLAVLTAAVALYTGAINWWLVHVAIDALLIIYYGLSLQFQDTAVMSPATSTREEETEPVLRRVVGG